MHFVPLIVCVYVYLIQRGEGEIQHIAEFGNLFHDYCSHNPPKALFYLSCLHTIAPSRGLRPWLCLCTYKTWYQFFFGRNLGPKAKVNKKLDLIGNSCNSVLLWCRLRVREKNTNIRKGCHKFWPAWSFWHPHPGHWATGRVRGFNFLSALPNLTQIGHFVYVF